MGVNALQSNNSCCFDTTNVAELRCLVKINRILHLHRNKKTLPNSISCWLSIEVSVNLAIKGSFICCAASVGFKSTFIVAPGHPETERGEQSKFI